MSTSSSEMQSTMKKLVNPKLNSMSWSIPTFKILPKNSVCASTGLIWSNRCLKRRPKASTNKINKKSLKKLAFIRIIVVSSASRPYSNPQKTPVWDLHTSETQESSKHQNNFYNLNICWKKVILIIINLKYHKLNTIPIKRTLAKV